MKAILHADRQWGIGRNNSLMFSVPADMKFFKETTTGNVVVMGANTLRSFPGGRPLKNRVNIVLSRTMQSSEGVKVARDLGELFSLLSEYDTDRVYVIGGAAVYGQLLPYCDEVLVTKVDACGNADTFFENLDENENFSLVSRPEDIVTNGYTINFCIYKNLNVRKFGA